MAKKKKITKVTKSKGKPKSKSKKKNKIPSVLLVGGGRWGFIHLKNWQRLHKEGHCNFLGVCDLDEERLAYVHKLTGTPIFNSSDDETLKKADLIDIVVPTYEHFKISKRALQLGKDILVEKPVTSTTKEAEKLKKIQKEHSNILMVGHLFRYNPAVDKAKELIEQGEIGEILFLRGDFKGFRAKEYDAGILATTSIHFLYLSNFLMGKVPREVGAFTDCNVGSKLDDHCIVRLGYGENNGYSLIESDYFTTKKLRVFEIIGTQGIIYLDALNQKVELHRKRHEYSRMRFQVNDDGVLNQDIKFQEPLYLELKHFLDCSKSRKQPLTPIDDGIEVLKIIEAAYKSAKNDRTVKL